MAALKAADNKPVNYRLSVRQAADMLCQNGDLQHRDRPVASALEGQDVHRRLQANWPAQVNKEVTLKWCFQQPGYQMHLSGRIDGLHSEPDRVRFMEIKSLRHPPELLPDAIRMRHRLQVLLYAHLWYLNHPRQQPEQLAISLIYFDTQQQKTSEDNEHYTPETLVALTSPLITSLQAWFHQLFQHRRQRNECLAAITFPFPFRTGQRNLAAQVFRAIRQQQQALIEAPTGSGKSLATLFPALKSLAAGYGDQIIVSTAKNATQHVALVAVELLDLRKPGLRTLQLAAKEKICVQDSVCNWLDCPRQSGFFTRLEPAMQACFERSFVDSQALREIALQHSVCPHGLQRYLQPWFDLLIGDYNYIFSPTVRSDFVFSFNRTVLLIDEAHNLPDRARELFSARLDSQELKQLLSLQLSPHTPLAKAIRSLLATLSTFNPALEGWQSETTLHKKLSNFDQCAEQWLLSPHDLLTASNLDALAATEQVLHRVRQWLLISEKSGDEFVCLHDQYGNKPGSQRQALQAEVCLHLRCLSPARLLQHYFTASEASILFSATLTPPTFYQHLLGLSAQASKWRITSVFPAENTRVIAATYINMRSNARSAQLPATIQLIADTYQAQPGNYWVYTPSFDYQNRLAAVFAETFPNIEVACQPQGNQLHQQEFLQRFSEHSQVVGFTVLGGVFGEGVDLPGKRLIGAIILGPGLPQMSPINDHMSHYFEQQGLDGFAYTYQLPGWQKVVQAGGRVIRTASDQGIIVLADDRFSQPSYQALLPAHWPSLRCSNPSELKRELTQFWRYHGR